MSAWRDLVRRLGPVRTFGIALGLSIALGSLAVPATDARPSFDEYAYDSPAASTTLPTKPRSAARGVGTRSGHDAGRSTSAFALRRAAKTEAAAGRDALGRFTGAGGYGAAAEARGLSEYELATGQTVVRSQVRASLAEGGNGRFYDGLVQNADGTYTGIEVKSGTASLSASQRAFDEAVNGGQAARAMLNGRPIDITRTELVRVR